jgi:hypothetical protein
MPIVRGTHQADTNFTIINNSVVRDPNLSLGAIGLLAQLLSHQPGWKITQESLARANKVGKDAIRTLLGELMAAGYLERSAERERNDAGQLAGYVYTTKDREVTTAGCPTLAEPTLGEPTLAEPPHKKTITKKTIIKKTNNQDFEIFWNLYPRKTAKGEALKAWQKNSAHAEEIIEGVTKYANDPNLPPTQFVPHPATWLNQKRWLDGNLPERVKSPEERLQGALEASQDKARREREASKRLLAEIESQKSEPPPICPHGSTIARCIVCIRGLNND